MREYELIADRIAADGPGSVLDWGCGWGQVSSLLHERGVSVEAYDYREGEPVHEIQLDRFSGFRVQVSGEPVALPYPDDSFESVLSCGVLEHVQDPDESLEEVRRILAPGGRLYVYKLPNRLSYLEAIAKRAGLYYHGALPDDRLYDVTETRRILTAHGFRIDELRLANMLPLTLSHPFAARHAERIWRANRALARVPGINRLATNVEAVATAAAQ
jgi:ubiquinone/menaquinone biosynthesis C-methylase UbiE